MISEAKIIRSMTLEQKAGQLFTFGFSGPAMTPEVKEIIVKFHAGGLRITPEVKSFDPTYKKIQSVARNKETGDPLPYPAPYFRPADLAGTLENLQEIAISRPGGIPLHISADIEGGASADLSRGYPLFPAPMGLACAKDKKIFYEVGKTIGKLARATGCNMLHSPVLDVVSHPHSPEINTRSYSDDPETTVLYAGETVKAFLEEGIIATGKHFPGRGYSNKDVHYEKDLCPLDFEQMSGGELLPYARLIPRGLPAIMLAHSAYPALSGNELPATICPEIIQGIARDKLGFRGVITTDSITMQGIMEHCPVEEACAKAIKAGADLVLYKTSDPERAGKAVSFVKKRIVSGDIPEKQVDESIARILSMKQKAGLFNGGCKTDPRSLADNLEDEKTWDFCRKTSEKATLLIRDEQKLIPLPRQKKILVVEQSMFKSNSTYDYALYPYKFWELMDREFENPGLIRLGLFGTEDDLECLKKMAVHYDCLVLTNFYSRGAKPNTKFIDAAIKSLGKETVVVTTNPFPITVTPTMKTVLCVFSVFPAGLKAAVDILSGKISPGTASPVKKLA